MRFAAANMSAANYIAAGRAAAETGASAIRTAREYSPDYQSIALEGQKQDLKNFENKVANEANTATASMDAAGLVQRTQINEEATQAVRNSNRTVKKAGVLAAAGGSLGKFLRKSPNREMPENLYSTDRVDALLKKYGADIEELRNTDVTVDRPEPTSGSTPSATVGNGSAPAPAPTGASNVSAAGAVASGKGSGSGRKVYTQPEIEQFALNAGFSKENARIAAAIAMGESRGDSGIDTVMSGLDPNKSNEYSLGLMQINAQAHGDKLKRRGYTVEDLRDPVKNMTIAKEVYDEVGSFSPWSVYDKGIYTQFLN